MKITMFNWALEPDVEAAFKEFGFTHGGLVDPSRYGSFHEIVDLFVDRGLAVIVKPHVQVYKRKKGEPRNQPPPPQEKEMTIWVDTRRFQQR